MSVINESQKGDELVCLAEFEGPPQRVAPSPDTNHKFRIGERVRYLGSYRHANLSDNPVGWMVVFEARDGRRYAATQSYFVTADCWDGLRKHFARNRHKAARVGKTKLASERFVAHKKLPVVSSSKRRRSA
jgi:hypothetical protein